MATTQATLLSFPYVTPGEMYVASIVLPLLGIVIVLLRFYTRTLQKRSAGILQQNPTGIDDWLMLPALVRIAYLSVWESLYLIETMI